MPPPKDVKEYIDAQCQSINVGNAVIGSLIVIVFLIFILVSVSVIPSEQFGVLKDNFTNAISNSVSNLSSIQQYAIPKFPQNPYAGYAGYTNYPGSGACKEVIILTSNNPKDKEKVIKKILNDVNREAEEESDSEIESENENENKKIQREAREGFSAGVKPRF